jgi:hypothetical protein
MCNYFRKFSCKPKVIWSFFDPVSDHEFIGHSIKGGIDLHIIKNLGVIS